MLGTILIVILILVLLGAFRGGYVGPAPSGILGLILVIVLIFFLFGHLR